MRHIRNSALGVGIASGVIFYAFIRLTLQVTPPWIALDLIAAFGGGLLLGVGFYLFCKRVLRRVAGRYLGRERRNHTLQPTALVHEAWMKLQNDRDAEWEGRTHGLALAAQAMRRLLVDHGRHQKRDKRGGGVQPIVLDDLLKAAATAAVPVEDLLTL